jgi:Family of unknown function (DUF6714)
MTVPRSGPSSRDDIEAAIRDAFAGVRLGNGVSLNIAELIDDWVAPSIIDPLFGTEPDEDWANIPTAELDRAENIAHFDAEGLRYYLPALMLKLLDDYEPSAMWCIGTISALDQRAPHPLGFLDLLSKKQRWAIALYVKALPDLVQLHPEDAARVSRAFREVWSRELEGQTSASG